MVTQRGPDFQSNELTVAIAGFRKLFADGYCYVRGRSPPMWAATSHRLGHRHVKLRHASVRPLPIATTKLAASPPGTGRRGARGGVRAAPFHRREGAKGARR